VKFNVQFDIEIPDNKATKNQAVDWIKFMIGYSGSVKENNPLMNKSFDPQFGSFVIKETE